MKQSIIFLHGLFGALSNWQASVRYFENEYDILVPALPLYDEYDGDVLDYLVTALRKIIGQRKGTVTLVGNSLGGHVAILYAHRYPADVSNLVLTGSSGLYEDYMIGSFPRRRDRNYVKEKVEHVFYDPGTASGNLIDEVLQTLADTRKCFKIVKAAKATQRNFVTDILPQIKQPVLLIWGADDAITPLATAQQFHAGLPQSELIVFPRCGHAPMMEQPGKFNETLKAFLSGDYNR
jgi:pimeloyl-ACP methyl ester carboxylesterase